MLVLINAAIILSSVTLCQGQGGYITEQVYGRANQANYFVESWFGGIYEFLITIWKLISPSRPILNHTSEEKARFKEKWTSQGLPDLQIELMKYLGKDQRSRLRASPIHDSGLHLTDGYLAQMDGTDVKGENYIDKGDGYILQCKVPFEVNGAVAVYKYEYVSTAYTHDGKMTINLPIMPFEAIYNLGTEGRWWGFSYSTCYVRLFSFKYTGPKDLNIGPEQIQLSGRTRSDDNLRKIGQLVGKWAPYMMALAIDSALRSRATNYYYCW